MLRSTRLPGWVGCFALGLLLSACASPKIDLISEGYETGSDGLYVKPLSITDMKSGDEIKITKGDLERDLSAGRAVRITLACSRRDSGIGSTLTTRDIAITLESGERLSLAPTMQNKGDQGPVCVSLVNIRRADGSYRIKEFDRRMVSTVEGREIYGYVPTAVAKDEPKPAPENGN